MGTGGVAAPKHAPGPAPGRETETGQGITSAAAMQGHGRVRAAGHNLQQLHRGLTHLQRKGQRLRLGQYHMGPWACQG